MNSKLKELFSGETGWLWLAAIAMIIIFLIVRMKINADKKREKLLQEQKYLPGAYYLNKQAQPDPYPNFPGSIV